MPMLTFNRSHIRDTVRAVQAETALPDFDDLPEASKRRLAREAAEADPASYYSGKVDPVAYYEQVRTNALAEQRAAASVRDIALKARR